MTDFAAAYLFGPGDLRFVNRSPEALAPHEVRIDVAFSGICGTDLHAYAGSYFYPKHEEPLQLGHEFSGRVSELGSRATGFSVGDRVTVIPGDACYSCQTCRLGRYSVCQNRVSTRGGAWAASVIAPIQIVHRLADDVSDEVGALAEPLGCAVRAVDRAQLRSGCRVCILGGGPLGALLLAVLKASGAHTTIVSEPRPLRRSIVERLGADIVVDPTRDDLEQAVFEVTDGLGADVIFEAVGLPQTIEQALAIAAPGSTVMLVGVAEESQRVALSPHAVLLKELTIRASNESTVAQARAVGWLGKLDLKPLITDVFPLRRVEEAILEASAGHTGKILLRP
jgi:(R,R)-butanediol dehydrogenase/meso-butanediol dehydrogenase/diacetyl reductase